MTSRSYYYNLLYISLPLLLYTFIFTWLYTQKGVHLYDPGLGYNLFVVYIVWNETKRAKRITGVIVSIFALFTLMGFVFTIQHWPFGRTIFSGALGLVLTLIVYNASRNKAGRVVRLLTLLFPLVHVVFLNLRLSHLEGQTEIWMLDMLTLFLLSGSVGLYLIKKS
jgi:hypothetical protein